MIDRSTQQDLARLGLRLLVGGLMLFHGVDKITGGIGGLERRVANIGLPEAFAWGVYLGEVVAPLALMAGIWMWPAAGLMAFTMAFAVYLVHPDDVFALGSHGEYALELQAFYGIGALIAAALGPGRFVVRRPSSDS